MLSRIAGHVRDNDYGHFWKIFKERFFLSDLFIPCHHTLTNLNQTEYRQRSRVNYLKKRSNKGPKIHSWGNNKKKMKTG